MMHASLPQSVYDDVTYVYNNDVTYVYDDVTCHDAREYTTKCKMQTLQRAAHRARDPRAHGSHIANPNPRESARG